MPAVNKKKTQVQAAVCQYFCFNKNRGITKYISEYAKNMWLNMKKNDSTMEMGSLLKYPAALLIAKKE